MSEPAAGGATKADTPPPDPSTASTGELIGSLSEQLTTLVRDEVRLAQAEVTQKAKRLGLGAGLFGGAGLVAVLGLNALVTAVVLGVATALPGWIAGLIVGAVLFAVAGVLALLGRRDVQKAGPPLPTEALDGLRTDINTVRQAVSR